MPNVKITISHDCRVLITGPNFPVIVGNQEVKTWAVTCIEQDQIEKVTTKSGVRDMEFLPNDAAISSTQDLVVEVSHGVDGIDSTDLVDAEMEYAGTQYRIPHTEERLLVKPANCSDFRQDKNPPRHGAEHLKRIAWCLPSFLADEALNEMTDPDELLYQLKTVSRAFAVLQDTKTDTTLWGIRNEFSLLVPESLASAPNAKSCQAYAFQFKTFDITPPL